MAETISRAYEIRRREKGETQWHIFVVFGPDGSWLDAKNALEYCRTDAHPGMEYAAFEITIRTIENKREW